MTTAEAIVTAAVWEFAIVFPWVRAHQKAKKARAARLAALMDHHRRRLDPVYRLMQENKGMTLTQAMQLHSRQQEFQIRQDNGGW